MRGVGVLASVAVPLLSACSDSEPDAPATWTVKAGQQLGRDTTTFTAMVVRLDCNNGVTGVVQVPDVQVEEREVVVTFTQCESGTDASRTGLCPAPSPG